MEWKTSKATTKYLPNKKDINLAETIKDTVNDFVSYKKFLINLTIEENSDLKLFIIHGTVDTSYFWLCPLLINLWYVLF